MTEPYVYDQEQQIKKLIRRLEGLRIALLPLRSVLLWEEQWYPAVIFGVTTFFFTILWLCDPTVLTAIASIGLMLNFIDFIVPIICSNICAPTSWTGQKEKEYEEMCRSLVMSYNKVLMLLKNFYGMRDRSPKLYYIISIGVLLIVAWVGSTVNNTFLLYLFVLTMLFWPGLQHRGIIHKCLATVLSVLPLKSIKTE